MKMRFVVKQAGNGGERIGALSGFARTDGVIDTPTAALYTRVLNFTDFTYCDIAIYYIPTYAKTFL